MIELGKIQVLEVVRESDFGVYLNSKEEKSENDILLPNKQFPEGTKVGDELEVFIYRDTADRLIATTIMPKLTLGKVAELEVVELTHIGAFLDWGLQKDLFLPFKQQVGKLQKGDKVIVGLYIDKSDRLCATMKVYDVLSCKSPYKQNQSAKGLIYSIKKELGLLVAVDYTYHGLIPSKEVFGRYQVGDVVEVRIKKIRPDGKLELSMRKQAYQQIEDDAQKLMRILEERDGILPLHDKSTPERIKAELNMSKASFKRAVGRLLKEGAIMLVDNGIKRNW